MVEIIPIEMETTDPDSTLTEQSDNGLRMALILGSVGVGVVIATYLWSQHAERSTKRLIRAAEIGTRAGRGDIEAMETGLREAGVRDWRIRR